MSAMRAVALRCEHREDVPCVDHPAPRLGWALESSARDKRQSAYRILVAERDDDLSAGRGTLWDSGKVPSSDSIDIGYPEVAYQLALKESFPSWACGGSVASDAHGGMTDRVSGCTEVS